jgi:hypothetical protein
MSDLSRIAFSHPNPFASFLAAYGRRHPDIVTAILLILAAAIATEVAWLWPYEPGACGLSLHEVQPWIQEQRAGCPAPADEAWR